MKIKKVIKALKKARKSGLKEVVVSGFVGENNKHTVFAIERHKGRSTKYVDGLGRFHIHIEKRNNE